ncbi:MAG TPA: Rieske 2Fe-2S domain-containing protein [Xanthomonadales bacterium]|nr:Rieske 2Fe-2S domain-containing protein [Xanthomonadales bacterium]
MAVGLRPGSTSKEDAAIRLQALVVQRQARADARQLPGYPHPPLRARGRQVRRDERLFAVWAVCSHQATPLVNGRVRNCMITCPVHGARFNLETGAALNLPATKPIANYDLRVVDDWIEVRV